MSNTPQSAAHAETVVKPFHTGPLSIITLCTADISFIKDLATKVLGMEFTGPVAIEEEREKRLRKLWRISELQTFEVYTARKDADEESTNFRILKIDSDAPDIHQDYNILELGPFSIGIENGAIQQLEDANWTDVSNDRSSSKSEESTASSETVKKHLLNGHNHVTYSNEINQSSSEEGNVSDARAGNEPRITYSSFVTNVIEEEIAFFTKVLGLSVRSDYQLNSRNNSSLGIESPVDYRMVHFGRDNYPDTTLQFFEFEESVTKEPAVPFRIPHKGIVMWTFETEDIGEILARAHANQIKVYSTPQKVEDPIYGLAIALTLLSPSGFVIEVYHRVQS